MDFNLNKSLKYARENKAFTVTFETLLAKQKPKLLFAPAYICKRHIGVGPLLLTNNFLKKPPQVRHHGPNASSDLHTHR